MESPSFSDFRRLMDIWDEAVEKEQLNGILDNLIFFFEKDGTLYGASENSRLIYANIKNPDEDAGKGWAKDASFVAVNLSKTKETGIKEETIFSSKDIKDIKVVDQKHAQEKMK